MNKSVFHFAGLLLLGAVLLNGCTKQGPAGPQGAAGASGGAVASGTITGHVLLYSDGAYAIDTGVAYTAIHAILLNSNNTVADSVNVGTNGIYALNNVKPGTYNLAVRGKNIGEYLASSISFVGGGTFEIPTTYQVAEIPTYNIKSVEYDSIWQSNQEVVIVCNIVPDTGYRAIMGFLGTKPSVSSLPANYLLELSQYVYPGDSTVSFYLPLGYYTQAGFTSGAKIYGAFYGAPYNLNASYYQDFATQRYVFNALSPTVVTTMPTQLVMP